MSYSTKSTIINDAYSQLRISGLTVDPTPEDISLALGRLELMAHEWESAGFCTGYLFEDEPDPDSQLGVDYPKWQAFITNLALRLCPDFELTPSQILVTQASQSLSFFAGQSVKARVKNTYPNRQPVGSGTRFYFRRYYPQAEIVASCDRMLVGGVMDFTELFGDYLSKDEDIESYNVTTEMSLLNKELAGTQINYQLEAVKEGLFITEIEITTTLGRKTTRFNKVSVYADS